jgi:endonuclease/exonuclease/phosphatase family metal-dependent hydrolase
VSVLHHNFWRGVLLTALFGLLPTVRALVLLNWNVGGNGATDWSTNAPQVQAIGRVVAYLRPDVITFQEIPFEHAWQLANFVNRFLPGYFLARNSGTDGYVQSAIISRHPILRSTKWLDGAPLNAFGADARFARDLFEAEIAAPEFSQPLHLFTTHLKSGTTAAADFARRAAEASAVSNFFVNTFLPEHANRPYILTGDLNEDVGRPKPDSRQPVQRLANATTGLKLTTPVNPANGDERTWSARLTSPSVRYDYILPGGFLAANIVRSQVFRTSSLNPPPLELRRDDDRTASDHLPLLMVLRSPGAPPFTVRMTRPEPDIVQLQWTAVQEYAYWVEATGDLAQWTRLAGPLHTRGDSISYELPANVDHRLFRIRRVP